MDYSRLDLDEGFVLSQKQAIEFLEEDAKTIVKQAIEDRYELDYENASEILKDLMLMGRDILERDLAWVKFERHDMSASGMIIRGMTEEQ